jgi:hypothetical protein
MYANRAAPVAQILQDGLEFGGRSCEGIRLRSAAAAPIIGNARLSIVDEHFLFKRLHAAFCGNGSEALVPFEFLVSSLRPFVDLEIRP